jgi:hypothetical protein
MISGGHRHENAGFTDFETMVLFARMPHIWWHCSNTIEQESIARGVSIDCRREIVASIQQD